MKIGTKMLEDRLEDYEEQLGRLNSYLKELKAMADKHGTERVLLEEDLIEAEHNIKFYESRIAELKEDVSKAAPATAKAAPAPPPVRAGTDSVLPRTPKQGIGSLIISSISFVAGALLGSKLKSRKADKDGPKEN